MSQSVVTNYFSKKRKGGYIQPSKRLKLSEPAPAEKQQRDFPVIVQPEKIVTEIRNTRRQNAKRASKSLAQRRVAKNPVNVPASCGRLTPLEAYLEKNSSSELKTSEDLRLRLSPGSSGSECSRSDVVTAACDNHDVPRTPKRQAGTSKAGRDKRSRVTPKKLGYDFRVSEDEKTGELKPQTDFKEISPRRKGARKKLLCDESRNVSTAENTREQQASTSENIQTNSKPRQKGDRQKLLSDEDKEATDHAPGSQTTASKQILEQTLEKDSTKDDYFVKNDCQRASKDVEKVCQEKNTRSGKGMALDEPGTSGVHKTAKLAEKLLAKKKESPEVLKEAVKSAANLKDLQQTLMKIRKQKKKQKEKEISVHQKKKGGKPQKETAAAEEREFAYETLHSLAQEIPKELSLPFKYKILEEFFRCTDTVVSMLFNRLQVTTWTTLRKSVQEMVRKNFELTHLGQIRSVFPQAYRYQQEKGIVSYGGEIRPSDYQLTLEPVLDKSENEGFGEGQRKLSSGMLVKRRQHFLWQLVNIVKEHHKKFLASLSPPIEVPDDKTLLRWHPQFPLDRVPDVEVADLPKPPNHDKEKCHSAKEVLHKARSKFTKKAVDALKKVAERTSSTPEKLTVNEENNNITPTKFNSKPSPALRGVSQSLLAKIRAKEANKKMKSMVRSEEDAKALQQLAKLPDVARALRMLYITEKKAALPLEYICEKLVKCCTGILTPVVVKQHILLLIQHTPTWLNQTRVRSVDYVKIDKTKEIAGVLQCLQEDFKKAENA